VRRLRIASLYKSKPTLDQSFRRQQLSQITQLPDYQITKCL